MKYFFLALLLLCILVVGILGFRGDIRTSRPIEIFPDMASYDTFWKDWASIDEETVELPEFQERFARLEDTGTEFLGTVFAREVRLKPQ